MYNKEHMKTLAKLWITVNCCDGENRENSGNSDRHILSSPDLYELVEDLAEFLCEEQEDN